MYLLVFAVVAPWSGPLLHVIVLTCIPHQMPSYFIGRIQLGSAIRLGGLSLSPSTEGASCSGRSASWMVRHGVTKGVRPFTATPSAQRASVVLSVRLSLRPTRYIPG